MIMFSSACARPVRVDVGVDGMCTGVHDFGNRFPLGEMAGIPEAFRANYGRVPLR